jgi:hypothetical protein
MPTDQRVFVHVRLADDRIVQISNTLPPFPKTEPTALPHAVNLELRFKVYAKRCRMSSGAVARVFPIVGVMNLP